MVLRLACLVAAVVAVAAVGTPAAEAARGDRSRDRALGDALVRGFSAAGGSANAGRNKPGKTLPVVRNAPYGLAAIEPGQGSHVTHYRVETRMTVGLDAWGVGKVLESLPAKQRAGLERGLAAGPVTLRWSSRVVPFYDSASTFPARRYARLPASMKASHTLTLEPGGGAEHDFVIHGE